MPKVKAGLLVMLAVSLLTGPTPGSPQEDHFVSGQVLDPDDGPLGGVRIQIARGSEQLEPVTSEPDGSYSISFPAGKPIDSIEYDLTGWETAVIRGLSGARDHKVHKTLYPSGTIVGALDPVRVAPSHYKVEFENEQVRVLRWMIGPGEKTAMHEHPASIFIPLTDFYVRDILADGMVDERRGEVGQVIWHPYVTRVVENLTDKRVESIIVELKSKKEVPEPDPNE